MAIGAWCPPDGATLRSDHVSRFTSWTFSQRIRGAGPAQSPGTIGDGFDNAVGESFRARMQTAPLDRRTWRTRVELSTEIFDWTLVFSNRVRRHSSIGMQSPINFEKLHQQLTTAA